MGTTGYPAAPGLPHTDYATAGEPAAAAGATREIPLSAPSRCWLGYQGRPSSVHFMGMPKVLRAVTAGGTRRTPRVHRRYAPTELREDGLQAASAPPAQSGNREARQPELPPDGRNTPRSTDRRLERKTRPSTKFCRVNRMTMGVTSCWLRSSRRPSSMHFMGMPKDENGPRGTAPPGSRSSSLGHAAQAAASPPWHHGTLPGRGWPRRLPSSPELASRL